MVEPAELGRNPFDSSGAERGKDRALRPRNAGRKVLEAQLRDETDWGAPLR